MVPENTKIVVLAHPGSEPLVRDIWEHFCDYPVTVWTRFENHSLQEYLEIAVADNTIDQVFVLVPANLVPVTQVRWSELQTALVDVYPERKSFWGRVPVVFDKDVLADFLPEHDGQKAEELVRDYVKANATRPMEVGHSFGNYFTKVLRANPCMNIVLEALVRKRFLYVSESGWPAVSQLLRKLISQ